MNTTMQETKIPRRLKLNRAPNNCKILYYVENEIIIDPMLYGVIHNKHFDNTLGCDHEEFIIQIIMQNRYKGEPIDDTIKRMCITNQEMIDLGTSSNTSYETQFKLQKIQNVPEIPVDDIKCDYSSQPTFEPGIKLEVPAFEAPAFELSAFKNTEYLSTRTRPDPVPWTPEINDFTNMTENEEFNEMIETGTINYSDGLTV